MTIIGEHIREARTRLGMTQQRVATLYGCDVTQINGWERGRTDPSPPSRMKLARAMGLKEDYFLEEPAPARPQATAETDDLLTSISNRLGVSARRLKVIIEIV